MEIFKPKLVNHVLLLEIVLNAQLVLIVQFAHLAMF